MHFSYLKNEDLPSNVIWFTFVDTKYSFLKTNVATILKSSLCRNIFQAFNYSLSDNMFCVASLTSSSAASSFSYEGDNTGPLVCSVNGEYKLRIFKEWWNDGFVREWRLNPTTKHHELVYLFVTEIPKKPQRNEEHFSLHFFCYDYRVVVTEKM